MATNDKITARDNYLALINILDTMETSDTTNALADFCRHQIEMLDKKAAKSRENAAAKKNAVDPILEAVAATITDAPQSIDDIVAALDNEDYTVAKVRSRLTTLVNAGTVVKSTIVVPGAEGQKSRKVMAYALTAE